MSTGSAPTKRKPLFFKHRAPVSSAKPPALDDAAPAATLSSTGSSDVNLTEADSGVDLFRRAKQFFPKAVEAHLRDAEGEAEPTLPPPESSPGRDSNNGVKRRKVSHDVDNGTNGYSGRFSISPESSVSPDGLMLSQRRGRHSARHLGSESPTPPPRRNKGKGVAQAHTVNSHVVFTGSSPEDPRAAAANDDSVIMLDDDSDTDGEQIKRQLNGATSKDSIRIHPDDRDDDESEGSGGGGGGSGGVDASDDEITEVIDPEFEEYIIRARAREAAAQAAKAAQEEAGALIANTVDDGGFASQATVASMAQTASTLTQQDDAAVFSFEQNNPTQQQQPTPDAQAYRIFIASHFPDPVPPLIATVRMDQEMRHVKNAYLNHAASKGVTLTDELADTVLLTWKGSKIYNWTTGQSLKIQPDARGRFRDDDGSVGLGLGDSGSFRGLDQPSAFKSGGLFLEIWTEELYDQYLLDQERRRRRNLGEVLAEDLVSSDGEDGGGGTNQGRGAPGGANNTGHTNSNTGASPSSAQQPAPQRVRLVLKSRDYEKLNITAHGDTTVDMLIAAFCQQRQVGPDQTVAIRWDGDELEGGMTVAEAEMEDMDSVEVYVH